MPSVAPTLAGPLSAASGQSSAPPRWTLDAGSSPLAGAPASAPADAPPVVSTRVRVRLSRYSLILRTKPSRICPGLQGEGRHSEVTASPASSRAAHSFFRAAAQQPDPSLALLWGPVPELVPALPAPLPPSALPPPRGEAHPCPQSPGARPASTLCFGSHHLIHVHLCKWVSRLKTGSASFRIQSTFSGC